MTTRVPQRPQKGVLADMEHVSQGTDLTDEERETSFENNFRPRQRADIKTRLVEGEMVILDRVGGLVHQLNKTGTYIWNRCNGKYTPAEIAAQLCEVYEVDQETALRDVVDAIRELQKVRLLQSHPITEDWPRPS